MKYLVEINDDTAAGKTFLELVRMLVKNSDGINFLYQEKEDLGLTKAMEEGRTGEYVDTKKYLDKLRKK